MNVEKHWIPQFSETFHYNGYEYVAIVQTANYVVASDREGYIVHILYNLIDENKQ